MQLVIEAHCNYRWHCFLKNSKNLMMAASKCFRDYTEKGLKWTKKVEKQLKKMFRPAFGWAQHPKAGQNTQHPNMERLFMLPYNL